MADEEIQEVRAIRHAISQECDHDVRKLAAYLRTVEAEMRKSGEFKFPNQTSNVTKRVSKSSPSRKTTTRKPNRRSATKGRA